VWQIQSKGFRVGGATFTGTFAGTVRRDGPQGRGGVEQAEQQDLAPAFWQEWESNLGPEGQISYRYLGCSSEAVSRHQAVGRMRIRSDLRVPGGPLLAPLGIAMLDTAGINVDAITRVAPTRIDLTVFPGADDADDMRR